MRWIPPKKGNLKLNFDGFSRGNPRASSIGVCIRDHDGKVNKMLAQKIHSGTNNFAEALSLMFGVEMAMSLNFINIHIEEDSTLVINSCIQ